MKLTLKNRDLVTLSAILDKLHITTMRINRGKVKVFNAVSDKLEDYAKDESDILVQHVKTDEAGQLLKDDAGNLVLKDDSNAVEVNRLLNELQEEIITISSGDYTARFTDFFNWLTDCEQDLTTDEAILIDDLLEQFEARTEGE